MTPLEESKAPSPANSASVATVWLPPPRRRSCSILFALKRRQHFHLCSSNLPQRPRSGKYTCTAVPCFKGSLLPTSRKKERTRESLQHTLLRKTHSSLRPRESYPCVEFCCATTNCIERARSLRVCGRRAAAGTKWELRTCRRRSSPCQVAARVGTCEHAKLPAGKACASPFRRADRRSPS